MNWHRIKTHQKGSTAVVAILIFLIILLTGVAVWYVIAQNTGDKKQNNTASNTDDTTPQTPSDQSSSLLVSYQSTRGSFTLQYPKSWLISGYKNGQKVDKIDGDEDHIRFQTASEATVKIDNFGVDLTIGAAAPGDAAWPMYPNGTVIEKLKNGIDVWEDNQVQTLATGRKENECPAIRIASNNVFGFQLKSSKWLAVNGTFCWSPGLGTSYSYAQQRDSTQFDQTIEMLRSIVQL